MDKFSWWQTGNIFFLIFLENRIWYFMQTICMKCQIPFSKKNKKIISKCRLLKFLPRMLSINSSGILIHQPWSCLTWIHPAFLNSVEPDQLASEEANWSESSVCYVNLQQQPGSSNLIGWQLEVGVAS